MIITGGGSGTSDIKQRGRSAVQWMSHVRKVAGRTAGSHRMPLGSSRFQSFHTKVATVTRIPTQTGTKTMSPYSFRLVLYKCPEFTYSVVCSIVIPGSVPIIIGYGSKTVKRSPVAPNRTNSPAAINAPTFTQNSASREQRIVRLTRKLRRAGPVAQGKQKGVTRRRLKRYCWASFSHGNRLLLHVHHCMRRTECAEI